MATTGYDGISDVHGYYDALARLLDKMDYRFNGTIFTPPEGRTPVFIGDGPDRGPEQRKTLKLMWDMVAHGGALMCLGNHELNLINLSNKGPDGKYLRDPNDPTVQKHHSAFFNEITMGSRDYNELIEWFKTIPLFLELDGISYVHACWHQQSIDIIKDRLGTDNPCLGDEGVDLFATDEDFRNAVYMILMGPEIDFEGDYEYLDAHGTPRTKARNMWASTKDSLSERTYIRGGELPDYIKDKVDEKSQGRVFGVSEGLLNFGHYGQEGEPKIPTSRNDLICLDFIEYLTAYRFCEGDTEILEERLVSVPVELQQRILTMG